MIFIFSMVKFKERQAKRHTLYRLRGMSDRMLLDCDISPELLKKGIKAWPWRNTHDNTIQTQNAYTITPKTQAPIELYEPETASLQVQLTQRSAA